VTPGQLITEARRMLGTPFHHQGRQPGKGLDCIGVPIVAAIACGLDVHDVKNYGRMPRPDVARMHLNEQLIRVSKANAKPGDVFYIRWLNDPMHFAIFTGETIIHAYSQIKSNHQQGVVVEHRMNSRWRDMVTEVYRFREFA